MLYYIIFQLVPLTIPMKFQSSFLTITLRCVNVMKTTTLLKITLWLFFFVFKILETFEYMTYLLSGNINSGLCVMNHLHTALHHYISIFFLLSHQLSRRISLLHFLLKTTWLKMLILCLYQFFMCLLIEGILALLFDVNSLGRRY